MPEITPWKRSYARIAIYTYSVSRSSIMIISSHLVRFRRAPELLIYRRITDAEVKFVWARPNNFSSRMFFLNRYFSFVGNIMILLSMFVVPSGTSRSAAFPTPVVQKFTCLLAAILGRNSKNSSMHPFKP
ncbi:hypothetical protein BT96DRAFT_916897, partial [Gymnopus androsaceus JB14]